MVINLFLERWLLRINYFLTNRPLSLDEGIRTSDSIRRARA